MDNTSKLAVEVNVTTHNTSPVMANLLNQLAEAEAEVIVYLLAPFGSSISVRGKILRPDGENGDSRWRVYSGTFDCYAYIDPRDIKRVTQSRETGIWL